MEAAAAAGRRAGVRHAARIERERSVLMRYRARRTRRRAQELYDRYCTRMLLAELADPDLSALDDVQPRFRVIPGGRA